MYCVAYLDVHVCACICVGVSCAVSLFNPCAGARSDAPPLLDEPIPSYYMTVLKIIQSMTVRCSKQNTMPIFTRNEYMYVKNAYVFCNKGMGTHSLKNACGNQMCFIVERNGFCGSFLHSVDFFF